GGIEIASDDAAMSDYLADAWLAHLFRDDEYTAPSTTYLGQYTTTPTASDPGVEVSSDGYDRQAAVWDATGLGTHVLDNLVSWAPLGADDLTLSGWALHDDDSGGNVLWFDSWAVPVEVDAGDTFEMA